MENETMSFDIIIVGAGPAGLAAGIKLKQLALAEDREVSVCILEKGSQVGAHILSGAVLDPVSLKTLLGDKWQTAPLDTPVSDDKFYLLSKTRAYRLPTPSQMKNEGNFIISLGELCQFLATEAEALGCEIFPGFAAAELLYDTNGAVVGVATGEAGLDKKGNRTDNYQPAMHLHAKQTLFAEGCRGQLSQVLMDKFHLRKEANPQTYGIGFKEIWRVESEAYQAGTVVHTVGWPLDKNTYGGSFIYHLSDHRVALGFVVGLDYQNPWLNPFAEFQRFKHHRFIRPLLEGGERIAYGARALVEGGWQSLPKLTFPGGMLIGDAAGFINVPRIKGIHNAIQSGIIAADSCFKALKTESAGAEIETFNQEIKTSSIGRELYKVRNIRPGFKYGLYVGMLNAAFETYISRGHSPWTMTNHADYSSLQTTKKSKKIEYQKPDNKLSFDRLSSVYLSNTFHEENQPCHLIIKNPELILKNYELYASPETRYCPAAVYEIIEKDNQPQLQINAQNCIHCKTCDIKDPFQNILWKAPEGGGGPNYMSM